jgi:serine/threonine protein kinase
VAHQVAETLELGEGDSFGSYTVRARLGEGGMGHVFRASDRAGTDIALKVLRPELGADEGFRRRFEREATMASKVDHPNVVPILEHGEADGMLYLTQSYVDGGSLDARLEREGPLPLEDTLRICDQVASGLDAMHASGLVHRDVKPHNVLLDRDGTAYVGDLGLAKDREASVILTKLGQAVGSIHYMSPEQIRAERRPDARTDVYGLGCVVHECVSGSPPVASRKPMQVMWAHLRNDPPDPCEGRDDLPPGFGAAVNRALEKEPEQRPPIPSAYAESLRLAAGVPGSGVPS